MIRALRWLERVLVATSVGLAGWCTAVLIEARYTRHLPVPEPQATVQAGSTLPGEGEPDDIAPAAGTWVARLEVPSLSLSATVLEGTDDRTLRRAAGHINNTAMPGQHGNVGIAGHRDTVFRPLRDVHVGDRVVVTTRDEILEYRVASVAIVNPEDVDVLDPTSEPALTLVTCYPFTFIGFAPQRLIVRADLTTVTKRGTRSGDLLPDHR